jgi:DNA-binding PadR family transcriptional regulator
MIELAILGVLADQELHGYELTKRLPELIGSGTSVSYGSVYPALSRLERAGLVKAVEAGRSPASIPMTGSLAGELAAARSRATESAPASRRARKVYGITAEGESRLVELLVDPAGTANGPAFDVRLALFRHLASAQRVSVLEGRRAALEIRRDELRRITPSDRYHLARQSRELAHIDHDMAWLANLIRAEQAHDNPGGIS